MNPTRCVANNRITEIRTVVGIVVLATSLCCVEAAGQSMRPAATCGVDHAQTASIRSSGGFTALLKMHSEDDHGKETHLCQAEYTLEITRPDGSAMQPVEFGASDDAWDRPLVFGIDGFSTDGDDVFVSISDGKYPQTVEVLEYNMKKGETVSDLFLDRRSMKQLGSECADTLRIVGTSPAERIVLGSDRAGCRLWEIGPEKKVARTAGRVVPERPRVFPSVAQLTKLDPGTRSQR